MISSPLIASPPRARVDPRPQKCVRGYGKRAARLRPRWPAAMWNAARGAPSRPTTRCVATASGWTATTATGSTLEVPGHWRSDPDLATSDGPILYRRRFELPPPAPEQRRWITFDGIFYQADVWLDGAYLGDPEGYFFPHSFDVTALSPPGRRPRARRRGGLPPRTRRPAAGATSPGCSSSPRRSPGTGTPAGSGGRSSSTTPARCKLDRLRVLCRDADDTRAHLRLTPASTATSPARSACAPPPTARRSARPSTPWPRAPTRSSGRSTSTGRGSGGRGRSATSPSRTSRSAVLVDGAASDRRARRTGLREVALNDWVCSVNGERLFIKGANVLPTRPGLADATPAEVRRDVELAVEAGLDVLRVQAHIADPSCTAPPTSWASLLLQDFPLQWGYARQIRREAMRQVREAVDALGHHPSIVQWCAHDEPVADAPQVEGDRRGRGCAGSSRQQLPTWNKSVLDRWLKRAFEKADPTRPTIAHSGCSPTSPSSTEPTATSGSAGTAGRSASSPSGPDRARGWCASWRVRHPVRAAGRRPSTSTARADQGSTGRPRRATRARGRGRARAAPVEKYPRSPPGAGRRSATGRPAAPPHRDAAATEVPTDRWVLLLLARRYVADDVGVGARSRPGAEAAWAAVLDACRPVIVVFDALPDPSIPPGRSLDPRRPRSRRLRREPAPPPSRSRARSGGAAAAVGLPRRGRRGRVRPRRAAHLDVPDHPATCSSAWR